MSRASEDVAQAKGHLPLQTVKLGAPSAKAAHEAHNAAYVREAERVQREFKAAAAQRRRAWRPLTEDEADASTRAAMRLAGAERRDRK